jgi:predicted metal-binding membrane protein
LLLVAGVYQFTPLKHVCLAKCRAPMGFLITEWRDGIRGKFVMGVCHGAYCIGCCWLLMALLFVGGVMSLLWIAALTIVILAEKLLPNGRFVSATLGLIAVGWGTWLLANAQPVIERTPKAPLNLHVNFLIELNSPTTQSYRRDCCVV